MQETPEQIAERVVGAFQGNWDWIDKPSSTASIAAALRAYGAACAAAQRERDAATLDMYAARYGDTPAASHTRFLAAAIRDLPPPTQEG